MGKTDYLNDPNAPKANSLVVAVTVIVRDDHDRILMIKRSDNELWALPGGSQDLGESTPQAAVREVEEETGLHVELTGISGLYSDPNHVIAYDNGEVRQEFSVCFHATMVGGTLRPSSESLDVRWIDPRDIDQLSMHPSMRLRVRHGLVRRGEPHIG